jgi:hypothetical protein
VGDPHVDILAAQLSPTRPGTGNAWQAREQETLIDVLIRTKGRVEKPFVAMLFSPNPYQNGAELQALEKQLLEAGIPSFPSYDRAARAVKKVVDYSRSHAESRRDMVGAGQPGRRA